MMHVSILSSICPVSPSSFEFINLVLLKKKFLLKGFFSLPWLHVQGQALRKSSEFSQILSLPETFKIKMDFNLMRM